MSITDISRTDTVRELQRRVDEYDSLIRQAEQRNRDRNGAPSKQEAEYYVQAMEVCDRIINANLSQRGLVDKWKQNKKHCNERTKEIFAALGVSVESDPVTGFAQPDEPRRARPVINEARGKKREQPAAKETKTGFATQNACSDVSAETIESWYRPCPNHSLDDLIGMDDVVNQLLSIAGDIGFTETDALLKISPEKGICLYGFHGNGKTYAIKAFVNHMMTKQEGMTFIQLEGKQIHDKYVGVAEKILGIAFQEAIDHAPSILFFDELDNICASRNSSSEGHAQRLTNAFLESYNMLVNSHKPVIVLAATNNPWKVDEAALNRFTTKIAVPLPSEQARREFLANNYEYIQMEEDLTFEFMAADTDNFDFRDLESLVTGLSGKIKMLTKQMVLLEGLSTKEQDEAVSTALKNGVVKLNREIYDEVRPAYHASVTTEERRKLKEYMEGISN